MKIGEYVSDLKGKYHYALPGQADSDLSRGCNELIRQGAGILITPENLIEDVYGRKISRVTKPVPEKIKLESQENIVYSCLRPNPKSLQQLMADTGMGTQQLVSCLVSLELQGMAEEVSKNYYRKRE